jgi:hypothetical protein
VAATQITLFGTMPNLGVTLASQLVGPVEGLGGRPALVGLILGFSLLGLGIAMLLRQTAASGRGESAERVDDLGRAEALP